MSMIDVYICNECNKEFEYFKPYDEEFPKNPICTHCNSKKTKRKITFGGFSIKVGNLGNSKSGY